MAGRDEDFIERLQRKNREAAMRGAGGRVLGEDGPQMIRTSHITDLQNTLLAMTGVVDPDMTLYGYEMKLFDQVEHHLYQYKFDNTVRELIEKFFAEIPDLGERIEPKEEPSGEETS